MASPSARAYKARKAEEALMPLRELLLPIAAHEPCRCERHWFGPFRVQSKPAAECLPRILSDPGCASRVARKTLVDAEDLFDREQKLTVKQIQRMFLGYYSSKAVRISERFQQMSWYQR